MNLVHGITYNKHPYWTYKIKRRGSPNQGLPWTNYVFINGEITNLTWGTKTNKPLYSDARDLEVDGWEYVYGSGVNSCQFYLDKQIGYQWAVVIEATTDNSPQVYHALEAIIRAFE